MGPTILSRLAAKQVEVVKGESGYARKTGFKCRS